MTSARSSIRHLPHRVALLCVAAALSARSAPAQERPRAGAERVLRLSLALPAPGASPDSARRRSLERGVQLGLEEANRSAGLFGWRVMLEDGAGRGTAIVGGGPLLTCRLLSAEAERARIPYLNTSCGDDVLRGAECRRWTFHVAPSEAMRRDARAPGAPADGGAARVAGWDSTLERFGAAQLNDRHRARFARGMDETAWAGWAAVKVLTEAALRAGSAAPDALRAQLERGSFDGHKGRALSFRAWDHQLRQPLYVVSERGAIREAPAGDAAASARAALDRLGADSARSVCRWDGAP